MQRIEVQHHTSEQVEEYLREAWRIAFEMDLRDELQVVAFKEAIGLLSSKTVQATVAPSGLMIPHGS
jgi:hypothetical protein